MRSIQIDTGFLRDDELIGAAFPIGIGLGYPGSRMVLVPQVKVVDMLWRLFEWIKDRFRSRSEDQSLEPDVARSLHELLKIHHGRLAAALQAMGLRVGADERGNVVSITDPLMKGSLSDSELGLLTGLDQLKRLGLRDARLSDDGLSVLGSFPRLEALHLRTAGAPYVLSDAALSGLQLAPCLKELGFDNAAINGTGFRHLSNSPIEDLSFDETPISPAGIEAICALPRLRKLSLWRQAEISDTEFSLLRRCETLEELDLALGALAGITDAGVAALEGHPRLKALKLGDAGISDACVDSLLTLPQLKFIEVGDDKFSLESKNRLEKQGIELHHGRLKGFRREAEALRYLGVDFAIDREKSELIAWIRADSDLLRWELCVQCTDEHVPEHMEAAKLDGPPITTAGNWRKIEGQEFELEFENLAPFPTNPANIYVGWHEFPNDHRIRFMKRTGASFLIDWTCQVRARPPHTPAKPIHVSGTLDLRRLCVWSEGPLTLQQAHRLASRFFHFEELGAPREEQVFNLTRFWFPIEQPTHL